MASTDELDQHKKKCLLRNREQQRARNQKKRVVKNFECDICQTFFTLKTQLRSHMKKQHVPIHLKFKCEKCGSKFVNEASCATHVCFKKGFACDLCAQILSTRHALDRHKIWKHSTPGETIFCTICATLFTSPQELETHKSDCVMKRRAVAKFYREKNFGRFQCSICENKVFKTKQYLSEHMRKKHDPTYVPFRCEKCGSKYVNKKSAENHVCRGKKKSLVKQVEGS